jgi:flavin-dependent dehydrogenase
VTAAAPAGRADVAVLGAGPAGVAVAVGLARLGHSVVLVSDRPRDAREGGSARVLQALQSAGLRAALSSIVCRGERTRDWAGTRLINGHEYLIDRLRFDAALRRDAQDAGVRLLEQHVSGCEATADGWRILAGASSLRTRAVVEARGRRFRANAQRAPRLLAVVQRFEVARGEPATGIAMGLQGWYWFADDGQGRLDLQAVSAPAGSDSRAALQRRLFRRESLPALILERLTSAAACGPWRACAAGGLCREPASLPGRLLVGDAALAVDPLSGHGIYEAVAGAPAHVAAMNTWLHGGDWQLVRSFMQERSQETWRRKLAAAGGFYAEVAGVSRDPFWRETAGGYAAVAAALASKGPMLHDPVLRVQRRPVLNGARIELQRVVVSPHWPRGVWRHGDVDLAALLDCCGPQGENLADAARRLQRPPAAVQAALHWLRLQGALPAGGAVNFQRAETVGAHMARSST